MWMGSALVVAFLLQAGPPPREPATARRPKPGAIAGRIIDEDGEPVVEARVRALHAEYVSGGRRLAASASVLTNDLGDYRLYGLSPGVYYIVAGASRFDLEGKWSSRVDRVTQAGRGFAPTFFPGTSMAVDAQPVIVRAGTDVLAVDFVLRSARLATLSGVVVDSGGKPATGSVVMLNAARTGGAALIMSIFEVGFVEPAADGSFVFAGVRPGEYRIDVYSKAAMEAIAQTGSVGGTQTSATPEYASVAVAVSGDDIGNLRVVTTQGRRLAGRITVDGTSPAPESLRRISIWTVDKGADLTISATMSGAGGPVRPDGTFEVRGVSGVRRVAVNGLPPGWALESVRAGGADVTDEGIEIRVSDVTDVEVLLTSKPAGLSGLVVDDTGAPVSNHAVVIFPENRQRWSTPPNRWIAAATTDPHGAFTVTPLPAGDYCVAVVAELIDGEWAEAESLERLRASALKVSIARGEMKSLTVRP